MTIDSSAVKSAWLSQMNDHLDVVEYGHGLLVYAPLQYSDDDAVTIFVEEYQGGILVSDQGSTAARLRMSGVNVEADRVADAWHRSTVGAALFSPGAAEDVIAAWGERDDLGATLHAVAQASIRVDQLRWLASSQRPARFADRVSDRVAHVVRRLKGVQVRPNARVGLSSGRARQVTALVSAGNEEVLVQAVGGGSNNAREDALERCFHLFSFSAAPKDHRVVAAIGTREGWDPAMVSELSQVARVSFFDDPDDLDDAILRPLEPALT